MRYTIIKEPLKRGRIIEAYNYAIKDTLVNRVVVRYENRLRAEFVKDTFNEANVSSRYEFEAVGNECIEDLEPSALQTGD